MKLYLFSFFIFFLSLAIPAHAQNSSVENVSGVILQVGTDDDIIKLYPNPTSSSLNIEVVNDKTIKQIIVYSILGNTVFNESVALQKTVELNISNFKKGKYLVKIILDDNNSQVKSMVKI